MKTLTILLLSLLALPLGARPVVGTSTTKNVSVLQEWFNSYYSPEYHYDEADDFRVGYSHAFSPFRFVPRWAETEYLKKGIPGISKRKTYIVPITTERLITAGYRFKNKPSDTLAWAYHPVEQYLVIEQFGKRLKAQVYSYVNAGQGTKEDTGLVVESDPNTGVTQRLLYYEAGRLCGTQEVDWRNRPDRTMPSLAMMDYGGRVWPYVLEFDANQQKYTNYPRSAPYNQNKRAVEGRKQFDKEQAGDLPYLSFRCRGERNPSFPNTINVSRKD